MKSFEKDGTQLRHSGYNSSKLPEGHYRNYPFNSREGYWITGEEPSAWTPQYGYQRWSVYYCDGKGNVRKHAGECINDPNTSYTHYLDPVIDSEPAIFGSDWEYFVERGVEMHGDPNRACEKRMATSLARGKRHDMGNVQAYLAREPTIRQIMQKFSISRPTAYRWKAKAEAEST